MDDVQQHRASNGVGRASKGLSGKGVQALHVRGVRNTCVSEFSFRRIVGIHKMVEKERSLLIGSQRVLGSCQEGNDIM